MCAKSYTVNQHLSVYFPHTWCKQMVLLQAQYQMRGPCIWDRFNRSNLNIKQREYELKIFFVLYLCLKYNVCFLQRIRAFQEAWPKLEKWFDKKQNILVRVDADADEEELYKRLECVLQCAMKQIPKGQWSLFLCHFVQSLSALINV